MSSDGHAECLAMFARDAAELAALRVERDRLKLGLERIARGACAYAGSFTDCFEARACGEDEGPCPKCIARVSLAVPVVPGKEENLGLALTHGEDAFPAEQTRYQRQLSDATRAEQKEEMRKVKP